jgi:hypothetical protein
MVAHYFQRSFAVDLFLQSPECFLHRFAFFKLNLCQTNSLPLQNDFGHAATMARGPISQGPRDYFPRLKSQPAKSPKPVKHPIYQGKLRFLKGTCAARCTARWPKPEGFNWNRRQPRKRSWWQRTPEHLPVHIARTIWFGPIMRTTINSYSALPSFPWFPSVQLGIVPAQDPVSDKAPGRLLKYVWSRVRPWWRTRSPGV